MRHGRPLDRYIDEKVAAMNVKAKAWAKKEESQAKEPLKDYVATHSDLSDAWMTQLVLDPVKAKAWTTLKRDIDAHKMVDDYLATPRAQWSNEKIATYNKYLSGKVFIPQPFGTIRNGYERESGFAISKFMIIEVIVALLLFVAFTWLAGKVSTGAAPRASVGICSRAF